MRTHDPHYSDTCTCRSCNYVRNTTTPTEEMPPPTYLPYLGYWQESHWWQDGTQVYRETPDGLKWEGSYEWFSRVAADRFLRGDDFGTCTDCGRPLLTEEAIRSDACPKCDPS